MRTAISISFRDRCLPGGKFPGNGHRGSLNPLIATHAVIFDVTAGLFWAVTPPHQLGRFVAIDMNDFERLLPERAIAADPNDFAAYRQALAELERARQAMRHQDFAVALTAVAKAEELNPGYYQNALLLGEIRLRTGNKSGAREVLQLALERQPALGGERKRIAEMLEEARR
jgi:tetratricopeptide (TPR) repeat protein